MKRQRTNVQLTDKNTELLNKELFKDIMDEDIYDDIPSYDRTEDQQHDSARKERKRRLGYWRIKLAHYFLSKVPLKPSNCLNTLENYIQYPEFTHKMNRKWLVQLQREVFDPQRNVWDDFIIMDISHNFIEAEWAILRKPLYPDYLGVP